MGRDEYEAVRAGDPLADRAVPGRLAAERLAAWLALAEERLAGTGVRMYLTGGNDDDPAMLEVLERHDGTTWSRARAGWSTWTTSTP